MLEGTFSMPEETSGKARLLDALTRIAHAVGVQAVADGVAPKRNDEELAERTAEVRWTPEYPSVPA
jgi:malate dehydrogenase (oxaloacetate-decarboxylating)